MYKLPIPNREVYAVPVPAESHTFVIDKDPLCAQDRLLFYKNDGFSYFLTYIDPACVLHGSVDQNTIDFDAAQVVDKTEDPNDTYVRSQYFGSTVYVDYTGQNDFLYSSEMSLRSALSAAGVWFVNPLGEKPKDTTSIIGSFNYESWQAAQNNVVEKVVIIEKI